MTDISTAAIADASLRLTLDVRAVPASLVPLLPGRPFAGPARPVTHRGSVDTLLQVIDEANPGDVLVVDNSGRRDEACVGDLIMLEAREAGLAGVVIWGLHRDTAQLREIGLPLYSLGAFPFGPRRVPPAGDAMRAAMLDGVTVASDSHILADDDGVLVFANADLDALTEAALEIQAVETAQADLMRGGRSLRDQLHFSDYLAKQKLDPALTLRQHLTDVGKAIEV